MKHIISTIAILLSASLAVCAQDLAETTEVFNSAITAFQEGRKTEALESFNKALSLAEALGEEGESIVTDCKGTLPKVVLSISKDFIKAGEYDNALAKLEETVKIAGEYNVEDVLEEAKTLLPQVLMQKGNSLLKSDPTAAAAIYQQILAGDPTDGTASLRLGQALNASGKIDEAIAAFEIAAANGQEATAKKQISTLYLKKASSLLKAKDYAGTIEAALKCNEYSANPQAFQIAGNAAQMSGKNNDAITYFSQYLEAAPTAKNAGQIAYTVGALYQTAGNKDKAKEYYEKALNDPKYGAEAKKLLDALK